MTRFAGRARRWLGPAAVALCLAAALPPTVSYARHYAFVQALQFVLFAVAVPALLALCKPSGSAHGDWLMLGRRDPAGPADRAARALKPGVRAAVSIVPFIALVIAWRLPVVLDTLARVPALTAAELVTLVGVGTAVWLELCGVPSRRQPLPRPLRAGMAAVAMWTIWVIAYVTGMSSTATQPARGGVAAGALGTAADRQLAVAVMWAVPAICFVPVVYVMLVKWLDERDDPDKELRAAGLTGSVLPDLGIPPRPPRGWRSPQH